MNFKTPLVILLLLLFTECGPVLYTSVGHNVPLFQKKGEVSVSAGYSSVFGDHLGDEGEGLNAQIAAAIGNHTAIISSFYSLNGDGGDWKGKGNYFELGIGRFKHNKINLFTGEIFVGTGLGSLENSFDNEYVNLQYIQPFIQPSGGYSSKYFEIAFTPRIGLVLYTSKSVNLVDTEQQVAFNNFWAEKKNTLVFEPGITIRAGAPNFKIQLQYSYSTFNYQWEEEENYSSVYDDFISLGFNILISGRWVAKD